MKQQISRLWTCLMIAALIAVSFPGMPAVKADPAGSLTPIVSPRYDIDSSGTVTATVYKIVPLDTPQYYINGNFSGWNFTPMSAGLTVDQDGTAMKVFFYTFTNAMLQAHSNDLEYKFAPGNEWVNDSLDPLNSAVKGGNSLVSVLDLKSEADVSAPGGSVQVDALRTWGARSESLNQKVQWMIEPPVEGVSVSGGLVSITAAVPQGTAITVKALYQGITASKSLTVLSGEVASPVLQPDGSVTFNNVSHAGPQLYLVGAMNNWNSAGIEMTRSSGVFSKTLALEAGSYEYKFLTASGSWDGSFTDPLNPLQRGGNSVVHVPGLKVMSGGEMAKGTTLELTAQLVSGTDGSTSTVTPVWTLDEPQAGVTLNGNVLAVSSDYDAVNHPAISVTAASGSYTVHKTISVLDRMYTFNLHYYRAGENYTGWDNWIWMPNKNGKAYAFTGQDADGFATASVPVSESTISAIQRQGDWVQQDVTHNNIRVTSGLAADVWLVQGDSTIYYSREAALAAKAALPAPRYIELRYHRPAGDYAGWSLWVWNTGASNGEVKFERPDPKGPAVARIEIGSKTQSIGFKVKHGNWDAVDMDFEREISTPLSQRVTKAIVTQGERGIAMVPAVQGPVLDGGDITFYYRDKELYNSNRMEEITEASVKVTVDGSSTTYPMIYDKRNEYFYFKLADLAEKAYTYSFVITRDGAAAEIPDPENNVNGSSSFEYRKPAAQVSGSLSKEAVSPNENTVLTVTYEIDGGAAMRELYVDLTPVGGPEKFGIDLALQRGTLAVADQTAAGTKALAVTAVDEYGNKHTGTVALTVKPRVYAGSLDFDWDEARIYFLLTDRFYNGDTANDINTDTGAVDAYHGGDFKGLTEKLDYIRELGINTIWITPIVDNIDFNQASGDAKSYGYHGYWAKNFEALDEHLGDMDAFRTLIDTAHDKGIKVMVDVVLNHTGYGLKESDSNPAVSLEDKDRFAGMLRGDGISTEQDVVKGELAGLPDFITEDPEVRDQVIRWQAGWLERAKTARGDMIDYFRVDTVKHVEDTTWKAFKNALTDINPEFKLIGEQYGASIDADGGKLRSGIMDSLLDFDFNTNAANLVSKGMIDQTEAYLEHRNALMDNTATLGNFLSSHDEDGFLASSAGGDEGLLKVAAAMQMTVKGQPVIYYGEELGQSGTAQGNLNRYDMGWDQAAEKQDLLDHYRKLLHIRADYSKVFSKGTHAKAAGGDSDGYLVYTRAYTTGNGTERIYVGLNPSAEEKTVMLNVPYEAGSILTDKYSGAEYTVNSGKQVALKLPARANGGTAVLVVTKAAAAPADFNPAPAVPAPAASPSPDTLSVSAADLKPAGGKVTISLGLTNGVLPKQVMLPAGAAGITGNAPLEIKSGSFTLTIPAEVLGELQALAPSGSLADAKIRLDITPAAPGSLTPVLQQAGAAAGAEVTLAGAAYDFGLSVVLKDGAVKPLTRFSQPLSLLLTADAKAEADLLGIYYIAGNGQLEYIGGTVNGNSVTADIDHFSTYAVLQYSRTYADVRPDHWAYNDIRYLSAKHIAEGTSGALFDPSGKVTRAEFTALLVRSLGLKRSTDAALPFNDVAAVSWYADPVKAAYEAGLVTGSDAAHFNPLERVSREEMAVMLYRALKLQGQASAVQAGLSQAYADHSGISVWAKEAVDAMLTAGLMNGKSGTTLEPKADSTRAEAVTVLARLLKK